MSPWAACPQPRMDAGGDVTEVELALVEEVRDLLEPPTRGNDLRAGQSRQAGKQPPAEEWKAILATVDAALAVVHAEPQPFQERGDRYMHPRQCLLVVVEQDEVVDVAEVQPRPKFAQYEVIQRIQVHVGEELRRLVADREAAPPCERREQVVAGEVGGRVFLFVGAVDDAGGKVERAGAFDRARQEVLQYEVIECGLESRIQKVR